VFFLVLVSVECISIKLQKKLAFCAYKFVPAGSKFEGSFVVSGRNEDMVTMRVKSSTYNQISRFSTQEQEDFIK
jgi:hypothetical protein